MFKKISIIALCFFAWSGSVQSDTNLLLQFIEANVEKKETQQTLNKDELLRFTSDQIDQVMIIADEASEVPSELHGLWWMDGNPVADDVVSFAKSSWDENRRKTSIEVFGSGVWSWHDSEDGLRTFGGANRFKLTYNFTFNPELTFAQIIPVVSLGKIKLRIPKFIANFTMVRLDDGYWVRKTKFFGQDSGDYYLRRIVSADGVRAESFYDFLNSAPLNHFIPVQ